MQQNIATIDNRDASTDNAKSGSSHGVRMVAAISVNQDNDVYQYRATIVRIIDGDTVEAEIDLGFDVHVRQTLRLAGINAPEPKGRTREQGDDATIHLANLIEDGGRITVHTEQDKRGSFGRYLATLWGERGVTSINQQMVDDGHAVKY